LKGQAVELGVEFLLCITHFPLIDSDGKEKGFYTWWLKDSNSPVLILSYGGFDQFRPGSQETHRALTNAIVRALAGAQSGLKLHDKGPVNCPMFRNAKNDFLVVSAQQRFDAQCYKALKADGGTRSALEALLRLFDKRLASGRSVKKQSKS
jgi:hypothetical protein